MNAFYKWVFILLLAADGCCEAAPFQLPSFNLNRPANQVITQAVQRAVKQIMTNRQPAKIQPQSTPTNSNNSQPVSQTVNGIPTLGGVGGQIRVLSGTGAFASVSDANNVLNVSSGATLNGTIELSVLNLAPGDAVAPLIYTPSWGNHSSSWKQINGWVPTGQSDQQAQMSLVAPTTPGTYHIIFAVGWETSADHVASGTSWGIGKDLGYGWVNNYDVWNDGNDIADFNAAQLSSAQINGWATNSVMNGPDNSHSTTWYLQRPYPADAITLVVTGNSSTRSTASQSGLQVVTAPTVSTTAWDWNLRFTKPTTRTATTSHTITENTPTLPPQTTIPYSNVIGGNPVPTLGWPFAISFQVTNCGSTDLQPPSLVGAGGTDALGQPAQFVVTPKNPPSKIAAGQTVTLTFSVKATWNTFKSPNAVALTPTEKTSLDFAQQVLDALKEITKYEKMTDSTAKELPDVSLFLTAVNDLCTGSQLLSGAKAVVAEGYSFHLQTTNGYTISDQFTNSNSEYVWVLWQPYKTDVVTAYYIGVFADLVPGIGDVDTLIVDAASPQNVAIIMNYEDVMSNLSWYTNALAGDISFSDKFLPGP